MPEFNLCKTDFLAYLECPFKYYLIQDLKQNKRFGPRGYRDYSDFSTSLQDGMDWHKWFQFFHTNFEDDIKKGYFPNVDEIDQKLKELFFDYELERYQKNRKFWYPLTVEQYLESDQYRGIIDRIDQIDETGACRIIEYKSHPKEFDYEEMMFYALLFTQKKVELEFLPKNSHLEEIAIYYYKSGNWWNKKIKQREIIEFENYLEKIKSEILKPNWVRSSSCDLQTTSCAFKEACLVILL